MPPELDPIALNRRFGRLGAIAFAASPLGGTVARLRSHGNEAIVSLLGAQALSWIANGVERLWLSPDARLVPGKGIRGGTPVCWPWFADHPTDSAKPAHGFVRKQPWNVIASETANGHAALSLALSIGDGTRDLWPHRADVRITVTLADTLAIALETRNTGSDPIPLTQALHTYFRVSDIARVRVEGLDARTYIDKLDGQRKQQQGAITIGAEVDRIYLGDTSAITLIDDDGTGRRIAIASGGSASAVVWNPWVAKTARLGDMGAPDAFRQMLCIETANAGDDIVTLAPGATHTLRALYSVA